MVNYQKEELGKLHDIIKLENGKVFLHDLLKLTSCEISINTVPKGFKVPFNHKHKRIYKRPKMPLLKHKQKIIKRLKPLSIIKRKIL